MKKAILSIARVFLVVTILLFLFAAPVLAVDTAPTVTTAAATVVEETTATLNGNITATGGVEATIRGFYIGTATGNYSATLSESPGPFGVAGFHADVTGILSPGTVYYYKAFANNTEGQGLGSERHFLMKPNPPTSLVATQLPTAVTLSWTKGSGADNTIILYKTTGYPANMTDGTVLYNGTLATKLHSPVPPESTFYYRAWSYAEGEDLTQVSDTYASVTTTTIPYTVDRFTGLREILLSFPVIITLGFIINGGFFLFMGIKGAQEGQMRAWLYFFLVVISSVIATRGIITIIESLNNVLIMR